MSAPFTPYVDSPSPSVPPNFDAYIPVRVTHAARPDGSMLVYLPNGTAVVVNSRYLLCLTRDASQSG
jgi:hypothetical protein